MHFLLHVRMLIDSSITFWSLVVHILSWNLCVAGRKGRALFRQVYRYYSVFIFWIIVLKNSRSNSRSCSLQKLLIDRWGGKQVSLSTNFQANLFTMLGVCVRVRARVCACVCVCARARVSIINSIPVPGPPSRCVESCLCWATTLCRSRKPPKKWATSSYSSRRGDQESCNCWFSGLVADAWLPFNQDPMSSTRAGFKFKNWVLANAVVLFEFPFIYLCSLHTEVPTDSRWECTGGKEEARD